MLTLIVGAFISLLCLAGTVLMLTWLRDNLVAKHSPPVAVPRDIIPSIIGLLNLNPSYTVYDLGCGDARVLQAANEKGSRGIGIEKGIIQCLQARLNTRADKVQIIGADMFSVDLHSAQRLFTYLHSSAMQQLAPKLEAELPKGSVLVSCDFTLPHKKPSRTLRVRSRQGIKPSYQLYQYQF